MVGAVFVCIAILLAALAFFSGELPPQLQRRKAMLALASSTGADFPDTEIPQDFPFSLTDDLNWGAARHCVFWRTAESYVIAMDVEFGFLNQRRLLTLVAIRSQQAADSIIWSLPRQLEMRRDGDWVVVLKRRRYLTTSALLSAEQIHSLQKIVSVS